VSSTQSNVIRYKLFKDKRDFLLGRAAIESIRIDQAFEMYQKLEKEMVKEIKFLDPVFYLIQDLFDKDTKIESIVNRVRISRKLEMSLIATLLLIAIMFLLHYYRII
jgi:hypothetical protein